ncbi:exocyst complex [Musa troglodytarum]|uniref:Exocyst subunit Exo70 family protein n=1 Tax=Musa troglodytarum TaxID=320322 RepID=A0A9E7L8A3_9LILI|nr:exocyst complex [Musa troglodytarum]
MRRLERELHLLLSAHGQRLNPFDPLRPVSNVSDVDDATESLTQVENASNVATADIRAVAESMISAGYGMECVRVFKTMRKSFVDESVRRLGFERLTQSQIHKFEWEALESKIRDWLAAAPVAFRALFTGERLLCDRVFAGSDSIRESCFADVTRDAAARFLAFPELVARLKRSPEKLFRILDLHNAVAELWPDIESMFRFESTAAIRKQAVNSLLRLTEVARSSLAEFEAAIQRDASRSLITVGDVHPLTRYVMNYLVFLANYQQTLADIFADLAFEPPSPLPESFFDAAEVATPPSSSPTSASTTSSEAAASGSISVRIAWLVLVLICKLDVKAELYREVALSYLFLANNIQFIVRKVKESKLRLLLGDLWVARHEAKARHHAASCERLAWSKVAATVPADTSAELDAREA